MCGNPRWIGVFKLTESGWHETKYMGGEMMGLGHSRSLIAAVRSAG